MKYLIKNRVINGDHIKQAIYIPEDTSINEKSGCFINVGCTNSEHDWDIVLRGTDADRFWEAYISDAYTVVNP